MMIACSAGLLLTACATDREAEYSSSSEGYSTGSSASIQEGSGSEWQQSSTSRSSQNWSGDQASRSYSQSSQQMTGDQVVIPLHEERLNVGKRTVDAGTVTIRKVVTTETVNQPIELRRETLVIDREGAGAQRSAQFQSSTSSQRETSSAGQSGAGVSAQAGAGQSGAAISAGAGQSGAGVSAGATTGDTASAQSAESEADRDAAASAQADFNQSEAAGASTRSADQSSARQSTTSQSYSTSSSQNYSSGAASGAPFQEQTYTIQLREEQPVVEKSVVQTGQVTARKNAEMQRQTVQREVRREDVRVDQGNNARVQMRGDFDTARGISEPSGAASARGDVSTQGQSRTYQSESEITTERSGAAASGIYDADGDTYEDRNTLDDINRGSNTRGGAEDLQSFDESSTPRD